jgi:hypothetical protein
MNLDRKALAHVEVFKALEYVPTPKQAEFHAATEFDVLFGGSAGDGKLRALTAEAIRACPLYGDQDWRVPPHLPGVERVAASGTDDDGVRPGAGREVEWHRT